MFPLALPLTSSLDILHSFLCWHRVSTGAAPPFPRCVACGWCGLLGEESCASLSFQMEDIDWVSNTWASKECTEREVMVQAYPVLVWDTAKSLHSCVLAQSSCCSLGLSDYGCEHSSSGGAIPGCFSQGIFQSGTERASEHQWWLEGEYGFLRLRFGSVPHLPRLCRRLMICWEIVVSPL